MTLSIRLISIWVLVSSSTNLASSMPLSTTPSSSFSRNRGTSIEISGSPKIVDIALPISLSNTEDLVTWANYAIRLMASRINVTLNQVTNDSKPAFRGNIYEAKTVPRLILALEKAMREMPKTQAAPRQEERPPNSAPRVPNNYQQSPSSSSKTVADSRAFNFYTKSIDPRNPYNPFAGFLIEAPNDFNPFAKYSSNIVINNPYEQSGSRLFQEHTIYPGVGYLPLANGNFNARNPKKNTGNNLTKYPLNSRRQETTTEVSREIEDFSRLKDVESIYGDESPTTTTRPLISVPFEAVITITRDGGVSPTPASAVSTTFATRPTTLASQTVPDSYSTINSQRDNDYYYATTMRDPPDDFPPFFEKNLPKQKNIQNTQVDVVFDGEEMTEEKKEKMERKKDKNKKKKKQSLSLASALQKLVSPRKRNKTRSSEEDDDAPPIIRIVSERQKKLKASLKKQAQMDQQVSNQTVDSQEVDDYDNENRSQEQEEEEEEEEVGSLTALLDLLPLLAPILEDLSDPETQTDLVELLQAALPLVQGILEGDEDSPGLDIGGTIGPILANLSQGPDGKGSDIAAVLGPILTLIAPLIGPIIGPIIGPAFRLSSNPPDQGFSLGALLNAAVAPLSVVISCNMVKPSSCYTD